MKSVKMTSHAVRRYNERIKNDINDNCRDKAQNAYKYGKTAKYFVGELKDFLIGKGIGGSRVVVYNANVFIFDTNKTTKNKTYLITTYKIPKELLNDYFESIKKHLITKENQYKKMLIKLTSKRRDLDLSDLKVLEQACSKAFKYDMEKELLKIKTEVYNNYNKEI